MAGRSSWLLWLLLAGTACVSQREQQKETEAQAVGVSLECALSVPQRVRAGEPVPLQFRLTNRTAQPVFVLTWRTPLEGLRGNDFRITRDGEELRYQGPMAKRGDPAAEDYVRLAPGESAEAEVDVSLGYALDTPGRYRIAFRGAVMDATLVQAEVPRPLAQHRAVPLQCPEVETERVAP